MTHLSAAIRCLPALALLLSACSGSGGSGSGSGAISAPVNIQTVILSDDTTGRWSDPATWDGALPQAGQSVVIPYGKNIILDTNINIGTLMVNGTLICADQDLQIQSRWIMVHGALQCGTRAEPFTHNLTITLTGSDQSESVMGMGTKTLGAMGGGLISLHGEERTSWLMLDSTANEGAKEIVVESAPTWRAGDTIVISSTDDSMHHAETRTLSNVNGNVLSFEEPLRYRHFGQIQTFSNERTTWQLDSRAEVGLLSRNIRIQGDAASDASGFGGHIMIMANSAGLMSGVELHRMGQKGILARYPFHWHMADNVSGQYFRNSSIRRSYNRCVTVHGSHNATVEDNVCYDHIGHGYFLEDGVETGNVFDHNLGLLTRRPAADIALIPSDIQNGEASKGPATFWISNGDNTFSNNAAAGSDGLGFWYDTKKTVSGPSASMDRYRGISPEKSKFGEFSNNRVHASTMAFSSCTNDAGTIGYSPPNVATYSNLTVFNGGDGAVWPCHGNQVFDQLIVSDTGHIHHAGFVAPRPVTVRNSLFVANSELSTGERGRSRSAIGIYDFGVDLRNVHFENFGREYGGNYVFGARDADVRFTNNPVSGLTFKNSYLYYDRRKDALQMRPSAWGAVIHDEDGSFGLGPDTALVADHPLMTDSTCTDNYGQGRLCGNRYGRVELDFGKTNLPAMTHGRSDGRTATATPLAERAHYQSVVSVNHNRYHYSYEFQPSVLTGGALTVSLDFLHHGDTAVLELRSLPAHASVSGSGYTRAASIDDLKQGPGKRFVSVGGSLYVKLQTAGGKWNARDEFNVRW